ncbi:MAG: T9SS type A sorting domain-containing protein [Chitinophagaceae bacterium]|nr:T9SS type A sorting domain-containing protein [Chitinophagaceae bacterium]
MRVTLLFLLALLLCNGLAAQSDFATAEAIDAGNPKTGAVSNNQRYYYYKTLLPADGTVKVYLEGIHAGGSAGSFSFYAYDKSRRQIAYKGTIGNGSAVQGDTVKDTIEIHSRAADSIYLLLYQGSSRYYNVNIRYEVTDQSTNDAEPNGSFGEARAIGYNVTASGHLGYEADGVTDRYDYYRTLLPDDGTVKIYLQGTHTGGSAGSFSVYVYDKSRRQIAYKSVIGNSSALKGETVSDSLTVHSRAADSIYIVLYQGSSRSYSYGLRYTITDRNPNDPEPNNSYATASPLNMDEVMEGQLGQVADGVTDNYDYYKTLLPADGTVKVYLEGTHTGGSTGSFSFYAYDKSRRQIAYKGVIGNSTATLGNTVHDTIYITSRAADSIYLVLYQGSSRSYTYKMRYEVVDQSVNDPEPNGSFGEATEVGQNVASFGHLGYEADGVTDRYDYYKTLLPANGTVKVYLEGMHTGGNTGSFSFYAYDKSRRQIAYKGTIGNGSATQGDTVSDTIYITSRAADSIYLMVYQGSARSYSYTLRYEVIDQSPNDPEPNGSYGEAVNIEHNVPVAGHLGYEADGVTDRYDYYKTLLHVDGTVKVYLEGTHTGGSAGSFSLYAYDKSRRQIAYKGIIGNGSAAQGDIVRDTIEITSRGADSIYLVLYQGSSRSYSYKMHYEVIDQSANDPEPNDSFGEAVEIAHNVTAAGHLGYIADGVTDRYDYYKTLLPADGTVTVYFEGTHTGGNTGSFSFYAYDRSRRQIAYKGTIGSGSAAQGDIVRDTIEITSRGADSLYFLVYQGSTRSYSYKIRYTMPDALEGDPEPNNTFNEATPFRIADTLKGLIGYVANGVNDANDYYTAAIPANGNLTIFAEGQNTGVDNAGFSLYVYTRDRRQVGFKTLKAVGTGDVLKDTLTVNCISSDSVYVLVYQPSAARSFTYNLQFAFKDQQPEAKIGYSRAGGTYEFTNQSTLATKYTWSMGNGEQYTTVAPPLITYKPGGYDVRLIVENELCRLRDTALLSLVVNGLDRYTPETGGAGNIVFTAYGGGFHNGMSIQLKQGGTVYKDSVTWIDERGSVFGALVDMHNAPAGVYDVSIITNDTTYNIPGGFVCHEAVYKVSGEIIGSDIIRANTNSVYTIRIHNEGNVMAGHTEVYLLTPKNLEVTRLDSLMELTFKTVSQDTLPEVIPVFKSKGYPIDGELRPYLLSGIPVGGYTDLRFNIKGTEGLDKIYLWVKGPYSGSPFTTKGDDCFNAKLKLLGDLMFDGVSVIPGLDCLGGGVKAVGSALYNAFNYFTGRSSGKAASASFGKTVAGFAKDCAGEIAAVSGVATTISPAVEYADMTADVAILLSDLDVNIQQIRADCEELEDEKEKPVDVRTSWDPNAKSGPSGFGAARYISGNNKRLSYTIFFENTSTATLPAQEVMILDTLDKNVYDLSTFSANSFGFGTRSFNIPIGASEYVEDVDYDNNLAVRFYIKLDKETGIVKATFKTIDKATGVITEDPLAGFLPPNINAPEGDGHVSFSIEMKNGLPDGTVIANRASIIFDSNEPILTDVWSNTIDRNLPSSRVTEALKLTDSTMVVKINGNDPASGVKKYRLYASENGSSYTYIGVVKDSAIVTGISGNTYDFYVIAVDAVGNWENKNSISEANVKLAPENNNTSDESQLYLYPIPSNGTVNLELNIPEAQQLLISVYSASGQRVAELYNGTINGQLKISKTLYQLSSGIYFVHARGNKGLNIKKKLLLVK